MFAGGRPATLRAVPSILEHTTPRSWASSSSAGELVRDARFRVRLRLDPVEGETAPGTRFSLRWRPDDEFLAVLTLSSEPGGSEAFVRRGTETVGQASLGVQLAPGAVHDVELEYVDGRLRAHVDGEELAVLADKRAFSDTLTESGGQNFSMEAEGLPMHVESLRIDRDLRYENDWDANPSAERNGIDIPANSYFMLGDNTANSADSRRWRMVTVHVRGGASIKHDYSDSPEYITSPTDGTSLKRVVDADGITRTWAEEDEDPEQGSETKAAPFVDEKLIVGRSFVIFWPCWPDFPGRLGFIH